MAVDTFHVVEKRNQELKSKLTDVEKGKRSAEAALDNAERQAKGQRVLFIRPRTNWSSPKNKLSP